MSRKKVFLVDDELMPMKFYVEALRHAGLDVVFCQGCKSMFDELKTSKPDLIVLDIMMPADSRYSGSQSNDGLLTGQCIFNELANTHANVPVLVLTNIVSIDKLAAGFNSAATILHKIDITPLGLVTKAMQKLGLKPIE